MFDRVPIFKYMVSCTKFTIVSIFSGKRENPAQNVAMDPLIEAVPFFGSFKIKVFQLKKKLVPNFN